MTSLELTLDEREVEALFHHLLWTLDTFEADIQRTGSELDEGPQALAHRRSQWPGIVRAILREVENAHAPRERFTHLG